MKESPFCVWAQIPAEAPFQEWWPALLKNSEWKPGLVVERFQGQSADFHWSRVIDSLNTFMLFKQEKALVVEAADKVIKTLDPKGLEALHRGPHRVVLLSENPLPKGLDAHAWTFEWAEATKTDDKASFRWIDALHDKNLHRALSELDLALQSGSHPLQLLQLLNRDLRLGRLIQYASQNRFREDEISERIRVPGFVIKKWGRRPSLTNFRWNQIFNRMLAADLELKSGADGIWVLRKVTFDLIENSSKPKIREKTKTSQHSLWGSLPPLWTAVPSFA